MDREELARLCAKAESTIRNWLRQGIIERCNPAVPRRLDLSACLPRILDPNAEFTRDLLKALEDLPPEAFAELRRDADELGVPIEALAQVAIAEFVRRRRQRRKG